MTPLNVVCLISGGKDSLFSILHCKKNGHNIVALANLHPPQIGSEDVAEDLDSYMYQTIGHAIIPLYEQALGLPLHRQEIHGSAVNQNRSYASDAANDETEALVPLLRRVQTHHPQVNAVSTGAILSDYQRTRVESVAIRLGLIPLSYLWQYPNLPPNTPTSLLHHMAAVGQNSRIVKVASGGLDDSFLWQNVADARTIARLEKAAQRFGSGDDGAVLGEGGEYETLAIAGPSVLWRGSITVEDRDMQVMGGDAGSASIRIIDARVFSPGETVLDGLECLNVPTPLEPFFQSMLDGIRKHLNNSTPKKAGYHSRMSNEACSEASPVEAANGLRTLFLADIVGDGDTTADQMHSIMKMIRIRLSDWGHDAEDVVCTSIILRNMADFTTINPIYSASFQYPNPPARVTVACAGVLPPEKQVMVSLTLSPPSERGSRNGLHVQSRSYWAPANIGPYSQAIAVPRAESTSADMPSLIYIAGQIPLVPASMDLAGSGMEDVSEAFLYQAVLSLQHAVRIARVMHVKQWSGAIAFITATNAESRELRANIAQLTWENVHRDADERDSDADPEDVDLWEAKFGANKWLGGGAGLAGQSQHERRAIPKPCNLHVVHVDALPREAAIEWVVYGLDGHSTAPVSIPQYDHFLTTFRRQLVSEAPVDSD